MDHENHTMHSGMKHKMPDQTMQGMKHGSSGHMMHTGISKKDFLFASRLLFQFYFFQKPFKHGFISQLLHPIKRNILLVLATIIYVYGGWPFLKGLTEELRKLQPGMMTLIGTAISVAFFFVSFSSPKL